MTLFTLIDGSLIAPGKITCRHIIGVIGGKMSSMYT